MPFSQPIIYSFINLISRLLLAISNLLIAKLVDPSTYGVYSKIISWASFLSFVFSFGLLEFSLIKNKIYPFIYYISFYIYLFASIIGSILIWIFFPNINYILGFIKLHIELNVLSLLIFIALNNNSYIYSYLISISRGLFAFLSILGLILFNSISAYFALNIVLLGFIIFLFSKDLVKPIEASININFDSLKEIFIETLPYYFTLILGFFYTQGVLIIASLLLEEETFATFFLSFNVVLFILTLSNALYQFFLTRMTKNINYFLDYLFFTTIVALSSFTTMYLFGALILSIFFPTYNFNGLVKILSFIILFQPYSHAFAAYLTINNLQKIRLYILILSNILLVVSSILLIYIFNIIGAAFTILIVSFFTLVAYLLSFMIFFFRKNNKRKAFYENKKT